MTGSRVAPAAGSGIDAAYSRAVSALFARRPTSLTRTPARCRDLCAEIGDPQRAFPSIHVTGTNGKTSVARMVTALLVGHGVRVGTFTSPHLHDVRERIQVDGAPIPIPGFVAALDELWPIFERVGLLHDGPVTFFEALTALALRHFADSQVDAGVVEVGIGGTHDATSVVNGRVAVLTPVALDHPRIGSTPGQVADEKAGIIAPRSWVVTAPQRPTVERAIDRLARRRRARVVAVDRDVAALDVRPKPDGQVVDLRGRTLALDDVWLPLGGEHQAVNAACALAAAEAFLGDRIDATAVRAGFAAVRVPGRFEVVEAPGRATVVLDGAHNPAAAHALAATFRTHYPDRNCVLVVGACRDKDVSGMLEALLPIAARVVTTAAPSRRAMPAGQVARLARGQDCSRVEAVDVLAAALDRATALAEPGDLVTVTGSLYLVAAARLLLQEARDEPDLTAAVRRSGT